MRCRLITWALFLAAMATLGGSIPCHGAESVRIGVTLSKTGKYRATAEMMQNGYALWVQQVNARNGLNGRKVTLVVYDDQSDPDKVGPLYERLITKDNVDLVLAPYGSPLTAKAAVVTERHGFLLMACAASAESIWKQGYKRVFGVYATADRYGIGFLDLLARQRLQHVAIIYENSNFAKSAARGARHWAGRFGIRMALFQSYDQSDELAGIVSRLKELQPDALFMCAYPDDVYRTLHLMKRAGYRPGHICFTVAPALVAFGKTAGPLAEGVFGPSQWEADERLPFPGTRKFINDFTRFAGTSPSYHAGAAFAACQVIEGAVKATGSFDQEDLATHIRLLDTVTVIGRFKVGSKGRQIGHNPILIQWQGGKKQIVYPPAMKTSEPIFNQ